MQSHQGVSTANPPTKPKSRGTDWPTRLMAIALTNAVAADFFGHQTTVTPSVEPPKQEQLAVAGQAGMGAWVLGSCDVNGRLYYDGPARPIRRPVPRTSRTQKSCSRS